jgi:hypothetical protein
MITLTEACKRVQLFCRIVKGRDVLIRSTREYDTHWFVTYGVPSLEDSSRIFQTATIIVEKQTGHLYYPPSRSERPIEFADFPSNRQQFVRVTSQDLEALEIQVERGLQ